MNTPILPQIFNSPEVRCRIDDAGEEWFCADDVCRVMKLVHSADAIATCVEADCIRQFDGVDYLKDAGIFALVFESKGVEAEKFRDLVFESILPSVITPKAFISPDGYFDLDSFLNQAPRD